MICTAHQILFGVSKSRRTRRAVHVARMERNERCIQGFGRDTCGKEPLEDLGVNGRIILK